MGRSVSQKPDEKKKDKTGLVEEMIPKRHKLFDRRARVTQIHTVFVPWSHGDWITPEEAEALMKKKKETAE